MARKRSTGSRSGRRSTTQRRRPAPARSKGSTNRRKGSRKRKSRFSLREALIWFGAGLGLGLLVLLPFFLFTGEDAAEGEQPARAEPSLEPAGDTPEEPAKEKAEAQSGSPDGGKAEAPGQGGSRTAAGNAGEEDGAESGYRFYTLLPQMEVEVPEPPPEEKPGTPPEPAQEPAETGSGTDGDRPGEAAPRPAKDGAFLLQVASFRKPDSAEALKAELALQGLQAQVVDSDLGDKGTWYRVRLGPYAERADAETVRDRLEEKGLRPMVMRR
jgi:cell division protein FtsN